MGLSDSSELVHRLKPVVPVGVYVYPTPVFGSTGMTEIIAGDAPPQVSDVPVGSAPVG